MVTQLMCYCMVMGGCKLVMADYYMGLVGLKGKRMIHMDLVLAQNHQMATFAVLVVEFSVSKLQDLASCQDIDRNPLRIRHRKYHFESHT